MVGFGRRTQRVATGRPDAQTPKAFSPEFFYQRGLADAPLYADAVREWKALHKLEPFSQITPMTMAELPAARFLPDARMKLQSLPLARLAGKLTGMHSDLSPRE